MAEHKTQKVIVKYTQDVHSQAASAAANKQQQPKHAEIVVEQRVASVPVWKTSTRWSTALTMSHHLFRYALLTDAKEVPWQYRSSKPPTAIVVGDQVVFHGYDEGNGKACTISTVSADRTTFTTDHNTTFAWSEMEKMYVLKSATNNRYNTASVEIVRMVAANNYSCPPVNAAVYSIPTLTSRLPSSGSNIVDFISHTQAYFAEQTRLVYAAVANEPERLRWMQSMHGLVYRMPFAHLPESHPCYIFRKRRCMPDVMEGFWMCKYDVRTQQLLDVYRIARVSHVHNSCVPLHELCVVTLEMTTDEHLVYDAISARWRPFPMHYAISDKPVFVYTVCPFLTGAIVTSVMSTYKHKTMTAGFQTTTSTLNMLLSLYAPDILRRLHIDPAFAMDATTPIDVPTSLCVSTLQDEHGVDQDTTMGAATTSSAQEHLRHDQQQAQPSDEPMLAVTKHSQHEHASETNRMCDDEN